eukprot:gene5660-6240_t
MALSKLQYTSSSYLMGALFIVLGVIFPLFHMMQKNHRRPFFRSFRKE